MLLAFKNRRLNSTLNESNNKTSAFDLDFTTTESTTNYFNNNSYNNNNSLEATTETNLPNSGDKFIQ